MFDTEKLKSFSWVNIANPDHQEFNRLQTDYKIDEDTIMDILDPDEQSRIETEDDYKVIIVRFPIVNRETDTMWHTEPLSIIYSDRRVITVCRKRCDILDKIKPAEKSSREVFILNIIYYIAESYLKSLKELNKKVFNAKKVLQKKIQKKELLNLLEVENSYTLYMTGLKGNVGVVEKLEKMRSFIKDEDCEELIEDARIELNQATEIVTSYSKMLRSIKETFESVINMDSNNNINRLTIWNIILIAPTIVVGYYGMNMELPFTEHAATAFVIFASIVALLGGYGVWAWWKKVR
ncbi:MAG: magnesium transporter CorA family protein [Rickettsiales bacterium]|jgi:magnesium transporter|nr:magnesium transporter CorA family protein [Rickettsiales bacterium]